MNRNTIREQFDNYISDYNVEDPKIALKKFHTYKVAELCEKIAIDLKLTSKDIDVAWAIGMLHDIGRFEQVRRYNTFDDTRSVDHACFGADLLFVEGLIEKFDIEKSYWHDIEIAIRNHNKYRIEAGLTERELTFCKIIRDADKIDIIRVNHETPMEEIYNTTKEVLVKDSISDAVYKEFFKEIAVNHSFKSTFVDRLVGHISLIYELEYPISYRLFHGLGYLENLLSFESDNAQTKERLDEIGNHMRRWIECRI